MELNWSPRRIGLWFAAGILLAIGAVVVLRGDSDGQALDVGHDGDHPNEGALGEVAETQNGQRSSAEALREDGLLFQVIETEDGRLVGLCGNDPNGEIALEDVPGRPYDSAEEAAAAWVDSRRSYADPASRVHNSASEEYQKAFREWIAEYRKPLLELTLPTVRTEGATTVFSLDRDDPEAERREVAAGDWVSVRVEVAEIPGTGQFQVSQSYACSDAVIEPAAWESHPANPNSPTFVEVADLKG